jgi:hypothetical protein
MVERQCQPLIDRVQQWGYARTFQARVYHVQGLTTPGLMVV